MICPRCRKAGEANRDHDSQDAEIMAGPWHGLCPGGTQCDCQHKIGKWINREAKSE